MFIVQICDRLVMLVHIRALGGRYTLQSVLGLYVYDL